jgi:hypothetical protein
MTHSSDGDEPFRLPSDEAFTLPGNYERRPPSRIEDS